MFRYLFMLLIIPPFMKINTICGLELNSSFIITKNINQRDDRDIIMYNSNHSMNYTNFLFENSSQFTNKATEGNIFCRAPDGRYLPIDIFALDTCARCYHYIPDNPSFFHRNSKWNHTVVRLQSGQKPGNFYNVTFLVHSFNNITLAAESKDNNSMLYMSFSDLKSQEKWKSCCDAAEDCCDQMLQFPNSVDVEDQNKYLDITDQKYSTTSQSNLTASQMTNFCPPTWDGWTCWPKTKSNQVALSPCPHFIYFETEPPVCTRYAEKVCMFDGTWFQRGETEKTNYNPCSQVSTLKHRTNVHLFAYAISAATILPALLIFYSYKKLNVYRIRLHKNMFISILLNSILVMVFKVFTILPQIAAPLNKDSYIRQNALVCRLILIAIKYLRVTNYTWMFCEGFYLHRLIASAFAEQSSFFIFYIIGWVLPAFPTGIYAIVRAIWYNKRCWIEPIETWEWILNTPCLFSLLMNMIFLINIIRILLMKLRSTNSNEPSQYRKAVRATLVLIPLFGLHFFVTIYRPPKDGCEWIEFYHYTNALLDGLQGCFVAIIFCYGNEEVRYLLKRSYRRFKEERCFMATRNLRRRTDHGQEVEEGGTGGIGCSVFLGRSNFSTAHFPLACSPSPLKNQTKFPKKSSGQPDTAILSEAQSVAKETQFNVPWKERRHVSKLNSKDLSVRETCIDEKDN